MDTRKSTIALNGSVLLLMSGVGLITPLLPGKILALSHSTVQVGILAAAFACPYILIQVPMGIAADRFGFKWFIVTGYILCGAAGLLYCHSGSSLTILVGRAIQGLGEAPLWALAPAFLSIINESCKGKAIGNYNASIHLGLTGGSLVSYIALNFFTEQHIMAAFVCIAFTSAGWTALGMQELKQRAVEPVKFACSDQNSIREFLTDPSIITVLTGIFLYGVGYGVCMTIVPTYLSTIQNYGFNFSGLMFIAFYIGITLAQLLGGPITDKKGRVVPMLLGLPFYSLGMLFFFRASPVTCLLILVIASMGLGLFLAGSIAFLNDRVGTSSKGLVSGVFYFFWGSGYFTGPILLGYAGAFGFFREGFTFIGLSGLLVSCMIFFTCQRPLLSRNLISEKVRLDRYS